jgi:hypothetical protein
VEGIKNKNLRKDCLRGCANARLFLNRNDSLKFSAHHLSSLILVLALLKTVVDRFYQFSCNLFVFAGGIVCSGAILDKGL